MTDREMYVFQTKRALDRWAARIEELAAEGAPDDPRHAERLEDLRQRVADGYAALARMEEASETDFADLKTAMETARSDFDSAISRARGAPG